jgi:perosamine synthetase
MIPISKPEITDADKAAVMAVLDSGMLVQGPQVEALEREWAEVVGVPYAIATSNGTTALHISLLAHNIGAGDEVITTPFTFIASVNSIIYTGATPVFVDVNPGCFNIDIGAIEAAITSRTKAILIVHLYGFPVNMDALMDVARRHNLFVIEDCAQAIGATYENQSVGSFGTGCFSLYATKNVHSAEGGMITTRDQAIARKLRMIRAHGMERRYHHDILGFNFRMSDIHAAIGRSQLRRLAEYTNKRRNNAAYFDAHISNPKVIKPVVKPRYDHAWHQYTIRIVSPESELETCNCALARACRSTRIATAKPSNPAARDAAIQHLTACGIGTGVFYPVPAHHQKHMIEMGLGFGVDIRFPVADMLADQVISIPVHPGLTQSDLEAITNAVNSI